jgi:hypothetical protein
MNENFKVRRRRWSVVTSIRFAPLIRSALGFKITLLKIGGVGETRARNLHKILLSTAVGMEPEQRSKRSTQTICWICVYSPDLSRARRRSRTHRHCHVNVLETCMHLLQCIAISFSSFRGEVWSTWWDAKLIILMNHVSDHDNASVCQWYIEY